MGGCGEAHAEALLAGGEAEGESDMGLPDAARAEQDYVLAARDVLAAREIQHQHLVERDPVERRAGQLCNRRVRIFEHHLLETLQPLLAQGRRQHTDKIVVLAVGVLGQRLECPVGQLAGIGAGCAGYVAQIGGVESAGDCVVAVPAAVQDRVRQPRELPDQVERLGGILPGDPLDDSLAENCDFIHEIPALLRIDDRARPPDRRQPHSHFPGELGRTFRTGKLEPE